MFGTDPRALVAGLAPRAYNQYRRYYRFVSGFNPAKANKPSVSVEQTGVEIEKDAAIVE